MTLTTEQLRARAKFWREKAVEAKWESVSIAQDMLQNADAFDELAANREAQPVGKAEITKIAAELVRGDYLSKLWTEAEKSRHVDTHRLQNLLDELHDVMKVKAIAITRLLTAPPAPAVPDGWIACSERMPDETQPVIVVSGEGVVQRTVYQFCDGVWSDWYDQHEHLNADMFTHWTPLPAAPEGGN
ncbi:DUF551 domain-containing protein [Serratia marcescens]|uniref:DUF551 domain-containing protein n=1 Tax=Serratia marcescens TaxID=615 RepID=UPI0036FA8706